jgi:copper chaperone CopZ
MGVKGVVERRGSVPLAQNYHKGGMMKLSQLIAVAGVGLVLTLAGPARAETKVELKNVHLCCKGCVTAVGAVLKKVDGVKGKCDLENKTVTLTADDDKTIQKALDALAKAGFHGDTGNKKLAMKDDSGVKAGKVDKLTLTGIHNCCPMCCKAIKSIVKKVDGVKADTVKPKEKTFDVTGDFDAKELVKALNDAGFHVAVKK